MSAVTPITSLDAHKELKEYEAHLRQLDPTFFLGSIVMYTVQALTADFDQVKAILDKVGLGHCMPKNPPADSDIFRRVFTNGERRKISLGPDMSQRLLVREVSTTSERIIKRIVAEDVDGHDVKLGYTECQEIQWNKNHPERVMVTAINPNADASLLAHDLASEYPKLRRHIDGNAVRAIIQRALTECHATSLREGGSVYFVSQNYTAQLEALEKISAEISGCFVHSIPMVDDRKQRDFVQNAFKAEAQTDVQKLVAELIELQNSGEKITPKRFAVLNTRYAKLRNKAKEYSEILKLEQGITDVGLDVLKVHMGRMFSSVTNG